MNIPKFNTKKELFSFLINNKKLLIAQKKAILKHSDPMNMYFSHIDKDGNANKANVSFTPDSDEYKVRVAINTTNYLDSHMDVHIPGIWTKSLSENKSIMHLQEHKMAFDKIISDGEQLKAYVKNYSWSELGYQFEGETQVLIFDSIIKNKRNPFMFEQYANGYVKNHSVGMNYVKLVMAINDEGYGAEFEAWEKYYPQIVNPDMADKRGYFWAVTEAKVIEGSAVPIGSNQATPTIDNNLKTIEPQESTQNKIEPSNDTQIDYKELLQNFNLKI